MKGKFGSKGLPLLILLLGLAALALRKALYAVATDVKDLLLKGHPLELALIGLSAAALVLVALAAWKRKEADCAVAIPSGNLPAAIGNLAAGAGILVTVLTQPAAMTNYLNMAWQIMGLAAPVCLLLMGAARLLGKRPFFLFPVAVCLFFLVHIVTRYQFWSSNPQMQDYVFALLGAMALTFFGFYTAAMEADCGSPRMRYGMGLAAIYLCLGELARSSCPALYLGGILWVLTELIGVRKEIKREFFPNKEGDYEAK